MIEFELKVFHEFLETLENKIFLQKVNYSRFKIIQTQAQVFMQFLHYIKILFEAFFAVGMQ